jgi:hypothetical protein
MEALLLAGAGCFIFGLVLGWLWGRTSGIEEERARQIDKMVKVPRTRI